MSFLSELVDDPSGSSANIGYKLYENLQYAKKLAGLGIFAIGGILSRIKNEGLWVGYATSWNEFCAAEAFSYGYAQTAIRVYNKYVVELALPYETIEKLALRDYTVLDSATGNIDSDNVDDWVHKLLTLGRQDLFKEIREDSGGDSFRDSAIDRVVSAYRRLDSDEQIEFRRRIA